MADNFEVLGGCQGDVRAHTALTSVVIPTYNLHIWEMACVTLHLRIRVTENPGGGFSVIQPVRVGGNVKNEPAAEQG